MLAQLMKEWPSTICPHKNNSTLILFLKSLLSKQLPLVEKKAAKDGLKS